MLAKDVTTTFPAVYLLHNYCNYIQFTHILTRKLNHKNIKLDEDSAGSAETVGVMTRSGKVHQVRWMGFISRTDARRSTGNPVKLVVSRVDGSDLKPGQSVQGCLLDGGAYAVIDTEVAILSEDG